MLFTAPAFMFVFLPLAMLFCVLFGKTRKKLCLVLICAFFYVMLNMDALYNLAWIPLLAVYAYFSSQLPIIKKSRVVGILLGTVPLIWLILMRQLAYLGPESYTYPVGITMPAICCAAYIWDICYGEEPDGSFGTLWLYLTFFPIMIVGPFLQYSTFKSLVDEDKMHMTLEGCSSGVILFAVGFIKRIAIGAVLMDGYGRIFAYSWEAPNIAIVLFLLILVYFGVFFSLSGYYDMATGISRMLGVNVPEVNANPLKVATVNEYSKSLFGSICEWADRYIIIPASRATKKNASQLVKISVCCACILVFIRADLVSILLFVPLVVFAVASASLRLEKRYKSGRAGLRVLFGLLTVFVIGAFWVFLTMGAGGPSVLGYIDDIVSGNAEYQTDMVLISLSASKYAFISLTALLLLLPRTSWAMNKYNATTEKVRTVIDYAALALLLGLFVFTVLFFLPQFSMYNYTPFEYIIV